MSTKALTRQELDAARCGCGCNVPGPLYIHAACHLDSLVEVSYECGSGELLVCCGVCKAEVVRIAVEGDEHAEASQTRH